MISSTMNVPNLISTSNISLPSLSKAPECASICASAPEVSPRRKSPSLISLPRMASGVLVNTSPVKSVLYPSVRILNLGRLTSNRGVEMNPDPLSVIVILVMTPPDTTAVPNAPEPPPPVIRTDTRL